MFPLNSTTHSRADFQDDEIKLKNAMLKIFLKDSNKEEEHMLRN